MLQNQNVTIKKSAISLGAAVIGSLGTLTLSEILVFLDFAQINTHQQNMSSRFLAGLLSYSLLNSLYVLVTDALLLYIYGDSVRNTVTIQIEGDHDTPLLDNKMATPNNESKIQRLKASVSKIFEDDQKKYPKSLTINPSTDFEQSAIRGTVLKISVAKSAAESSFNQASYQLCEAKTDAAQWKKKEAKEETEFNPSSDFFKKLVELEKVTDQSRNETEILKMRAVAGKLVALNTESEQQADHSSATSFDMETRVAEEKEIQAYFPIEKFRVELYALTHLKLETSELDQLLNPNQQDNSYNDMIQFVENQQNNLHSARQGLPPAATTGYHYSLFSNHCVAFAKHLWKPVATIALAALISALAWDTFTGQANSPMSWIGADAGVGLDDAQKSQIAAIIVVKALSALWLIRGITGCFAKPQAQAEQATDGVELGEDTRTDYISLNA